MVQSVDSPPSRSPVIARIREAGDIRMDDGQSYAIAMVVTFDSVAELRRAMNEHIARLSIEIGCSDDDRSGKREAE